MRTALDHGPDRRGASAPTWASTWCCGGSSSWARPGPGLQRRGGAGPPHRQEPLLLMALLLTLGGVAAFSVRPRDRRTTRRTSSASAMRVASALAVLFVAKSAQGEAHLLDVLSGQHPDRHPVRSCGGRRALCVAGGGPCTRSSASSCSSAPSTRTPRRPAASGSACGTSSSSLLGVVVALGIRLAGTLLVFGFLVLPGRHRPAAQPAPGRHLRRGHRQRSRVHHCRPTVLSGPISRPGRLSWRVPPPPARGWAVSRLRQ